MEQTNFVKYMLNKCNNIDIVILDTLTYVGNLKTIGDSRINFIKGNICNRELIEICNRPHKNSNRARMLSSENF